MIGIIVSGHINFASGLQSAVHAIVGEQAQLGFIDFVESISPDELEVLFRTKIDEVNSGQGVLFLVDLIGGTPCNRASLLMNEMNVPIEVVSGANLPMILNIAFEREDCSVQQLAQLAVEIGCDCIQNIRDELEICYQNSNDDDE